MIKLLIISKIALLNFMIEWEKVKRCICRDFIDSPHYSIEMSITEPSIRSDNNINKFIENAKDIAEFYEEIKYWY
jgi:hypothetical protein